MVCTQHLILNGVTYYFLFWDIKYCVLWHFLRMNSDLIYYNLFQILNCGQKFCIYVLNAIILLLFHLLKPFTLFWISAVLKLWFLDQQQKHHLELSSAHSQALSDLCVRNSGEEFQKSVFQQALWVLTHAEVWEPLVSWNLTSPKGCP